jgi:hypothetical protein
MKSVSAKSVNYPVRDTEKVTFPADFSDLFGSQKIQSSVSSGVAGSGSFSPTGVGEHFT